MEPARPQFAFPPLTSAVKVLILVNVAVFVLSAIITIATPDSVTPIPFSHFLGVSWSGLWEAYGLGILRLVTYQFAHSFTDPFHLLFNMLVLYFFGTFVESEVGRRGMYHLYLLAGLAGAVLHLVLALVTGLADVPLIGASGACYGIMVYAACMAPRMRVIFIVFPVEMRWLVGILVGVGAYMALLQLTGNASGGVAHGAHLGGAAYGFIAFRRLRGYYISLGVSHAPMFPGLRRWSVERGRRKEEDLQATLDRLLEKVSREGMSALTAGERRQLERASRELKKR